MTSGQRTSGGYRFPRPGLALFVQLALTAVFAWIAISQWQHGDRLRDHGQTATAVVTELRAGRNGYAMVAFTTTSGTRVTTGIDKSGTKPQVGDEVVVTYDPADPAGNIDWASHVPDRAGAVVAGLIAVIIAGSAVFWRVWLRRRAAALASS